MRIKPGPTLRPRSLGLRNVHAEFGQPELCLGIGRRAPVTLGDKVGVPMLRGRYSATLGGKYRKVFSMLDPTSNGPKVAFANGGGLHARMEEACAGMT